MESESLKNLDSSDDDDCSCDEDKPDGRRRRFCIERKQREEQQKQKTNLAQHKPHPIKPNLFRIRKLSKLNHSLNRNAIKNQLGKTSVIARKKINISNSTLPPQSHRFVPTNTSDRLELAKRTSEGPVIFINPKFIQRFLEKSLKLASSNVTNNSTRNFAKFKSPMENTDLVNQKQSSNFASPSTSMVENSDFKTKPRETLKAASTMAIIRLVTECIEDTRKRDEKLNKTLVSQLIDKLINRDRGGHTATDICPANQAKA